MIIVVDPGHGGTAGDASDDGAVVDGVHEDSINLAVALELAPLLARLATVKLTRAVDTYRSWESRRAVARGSDLVVSIHCDASESQRHHGAHCFSWFGNARAFRIAESIQSELHKHLPGSKPWSITTGDDHGWPRAAAVLSAYPVDTVVVELGYLTNPGDRAYLTTASGQHECAAAIARGIRMVQHLFVKET